MGLGGKFDGEHEMSAWKFTSNTACKYYFLGVMAFIWDVPTDLDPLSTYQLRFTINSIADEENISGCFRIQGGRSGAIRTSITSKIALHGRKVSTFVDTWIVGFLAFRMVLVWMQ
jgi:hypothetical protein